MFICGFQKLTLLDFPGKTACTVFTGGCDFRCPFCHNASLVTHIAGDAAVYPEDILAFLKKRAGLLDGVAITGGEPTLQPDLEDFITEIKKLGFAVKLDTNGNHPAVLRKLLDASLLDYVAMDIKSSPENYHKVIGIPSFDTSNVKESAAMLLEGRVPYEFRTTVVKGLHSKEDFECIGKWIRGAEHYFLQGFKDSGDLISASGLSSFSKEETEDFLSAVLPYIPSAQLRGIE